MTAGPIVSSSSSASSTESSDEEAASDLGNLHVVMWFSQQCCFRMCLKWQVHESSGKNYTTMTMRLAELATLQCFLCLICVCMGSLLRSWYRRGGWFSTRVIPGIYRRRWQGKKWARQRWRYILFTRGGIVALMLLLRMLLTQHSLGSLGLFIPILSLHMLRKSLSLVRVPRGPRITYSGTHFLCLIMISNL